MECGSASCTPFLFLLFAPDICFYGFYLMFVDVDIPLWRKRQNGYVHIIMSNRALSKRKVVSDFFRIFGVELRKDYIMSEEQMNSYRLTSMEEPGDERMAQIMREVAEDARESTRRAAERVAAGIEAATQEARARVEETLNRLRNGCK
jgi:hypothetical protein